MRRSARASRARSAAAALCLRIIVETAGDDHDAALEELLR